MYIYTKLINAARHSVASYKNGQDELYKADNLYAYKRGKLVVAVTTYKDEVNY